MYRCFISHPWAGNIHHFALRLSAALRQRKIGVWIDEEQMSAGQPIKQRQRNGIVYESEIFIFILAPETLKSSNCIEELEIAIENNKPIICANLEQCERPSAIAENIAVDFSLPQYFEASADKLVSGVKKLQKIQEVIKKLSDDEPEKRSEAARILGDLRETNALRPIIKRLASERDKSVAYWLLLSVGSLFDPELEIAPKAIEILRESNKSKSLLLKKAVIDALNEINERHPNLQIHV